MSSVDPLRLSSPVTELPGVGKQRARLLSRLDIRSLADLLRHLPLRYERHAAESTIASLTPDAIGSARGQLVATRWAPGGPPGGRGGKGRFLATLQDTSATLSLVWFNARYLQDKLHPGMTLRVHGKMALFNGYRQMVNPRWEPLDESQDPVDPAAERLRPIYPATEDLSSAVLEQLIQDLLPRVLPALVDPLPEDFRGQRALPSLADAYRMIHHPDDDDEPLVARRRLAYNELLLLQTGIALKRRFTQTSLVAPALRWSPAIDKHIRDRFPFDLTPAQDKVISQIAADLQHAQPMNRLLQGDVGSGKTVVALYAMLMAVANRAQAALMAPTELLAEQHSLSIADMLKGSTVRLELLTASQSASGSAERKAQLQRIAAGDVDIVIGTQALLSHSVKFANLAVAVVDEQHRFGVMQRAAIREMAAASLEPSQSSAAGGAGATGASGGGAISGGGGTSGGGRLPAPHTLVMTATPIPRTLSMTFLGDLDVSTLEGLPPGRSPIATRVVPPEKADEVYQFMVKRLDEGEQAYVVVPAIDPSSEGSDAGTSGGLKSVRAHVKLLADRYCRHHLVAAVHGRLKPQTRQAIMDKFRAGKIHVLVATTVIEVGVDVPNATVMIVEHAERFGLAQLHQLRGRVGRGVHRRKSVCVLVGDPATEDAQQRLSALAATTDGFAIAEADLAIRGMGEFFGTRQSGAPPLRVANLPQDLDLLRMAKRDADAIVAADPDLHDSQWRLLRKTLQREHGQSLGLVDVG